MGAEMNLLGIFGIWIGGFVAGFCVAFLIFQ